MNELYMKQMYNMRLRQSMMQAYARMMLASNIPVAGGVGPNGGGGTGPGPAPAPTNKKTVFVLEDGTREEHDIVGELSLEWMANNGFADLESFNPEDPSTIWKKKITSA